METSKSLGMFRNWLNKCVRSLEYQRKTTTTKNQQELRLCDVRFCSEKRYCTLPWMLLTFTSDLKGILSETYFDRHSLLWGAGTFSLQVPPLTFREVLPQLSTDQILSWKDNLQVFCGGWMNRVVKSWSSQDSSATLLNYLFELGQVWWARLLPLKLFQLVWYWKETVPLQCCCEL